MYLVEMFPNYELAKPLGIVFWNYLIYHAWYNVIYDAGYNLICDA